MPTIVPCFRAAPIDSSISGKLSHHSVNARLALLPVPGDQVRLDCPEK
jgi:hypothetical protein